MPPADPKPVKKQLIVVVHGVGIRAAGESSDLVAGALDGGPGDAEPSAAPPFRRRASDDFLLFETLPGEASRLATSYPARLTRFRRFTGQFPEPDSPERVISDVYWGDVGGFASSVPAVIQGLGRIMLGLAHVVRENALTVFPDTESGWQAVGRGLARGTALAIHGPIFALNITLLIGLGWIMLLGDRTSWVSILTAGIGLALAWWLQTRSRSFLLRHMAAYLALFALVLLAFVALDRFAPVLQPDRALAAQWTPISSAQEVVDRMAKGEALVPIATQQAFVIPWVDDSFRAALCSWKSGARVADEGLSTLERVRAVRSDRAVCLATHASGPFLHAMRLQGLMVLLWTGIAAMTLGFGGHWLVSMRHRDGRHRRNVLMPTLALMTLLWFLLIGLGWAAIAAFYTQIGPGPFWQGGPVVDRTCNILTLIFSPCEAGTDHTKLFTTSLRGIWAAGATLAVLLIVGSAVFLYRRSVLRGLRPADYMARAEENARRTRLIVPPILCAALATMPAAILFLIYASASSPSELCDAGAGAGLVCWLEANTTSVLTWIVALVTGALPVILGPLRLGINVAGDVIIYLNDFHWRRTPEDPPTRTFAELIPAVARRRHRLLPVAEGYFFRQRIQRRLSNLVDDLIRTEEPDRIDFVCHSQGTVITLNVLAAHGASWGQGRGGQGCALSLITMGSPWRHLYHHYFPRAFADLKGPPASVARWTNIFRIDDFIGTHVRTASPDELPIGLGGHTNYWRDTDVRRILQSRLEDGPQAPAG